MIFNRKGCEAMKDIVVLGTKIEVTSSAIRPHGDKIFIKSGKTTEIPRTIWAKYQIHPRRTHYPFLLASCEATSHCRSIILNVIKNGTCIRNIFKMCLTASALTDKPTLQSKAGVSQEEKAENNLSSYEDESAIEEVETAVRGHDNKSRSIANVSSSPIMNLFSVLKDNTVTL